MEQWQELVIAAQEGDSKAFGRLVDHFQNMAYFTAYRYLGERQCAQDAAQDAFFEAYRCLPSLRHPAAFPAWLRRIIFKHCDRQTRGQRPELTPLPGPGSRLSADTPPPEHMVENLQRRRAVRAAVRDLPPIYRQVTTLFYLNGRSYHEIAAHLDLPLSTVKKRLYDARQKLKEAISPMREDTYRPSQDDAFSNRIKFFIALKNDDQLQIRQLLRRHPELLQAKTKWGEASDGWYWPLGITAMHWAAATGNVPLAELLLEAGGDVNAGDKFNQSPLERAAEMGQKEMVRWLLKQGAAPDGIVARKKTPLHGAVIRERQEIIALLLEHGADPEAADENDRTPLDWAKLKGLTAVAGQMGEEIRAEPQTPLDPLGETWETGIKIIDLMAPLQRNGRNGMFTPIPGIGFDVTLAEIMHNLTVYRGGVTIQLGLARGAFSVESRRRQWRNAGVDQYVELFFGEIDDSIAHKQHLVKQGIKAAEARCAAGHEVLFAIYTDLALSDGVMDLLEGMTTRHGDRTITILFLGPETIGAEPPPLADLDAAFTFDRFRAGLGWWPAVDPIRSYSTAFVDEAHAGLARRARRLCRRYVDLDLIYQKQGIEGFQYDFFTAADRQDVGRARRLHHYLTQPLMIVEPWTMQPGAVVPLSQTLATINDLMEGKMDDVPEEDLAYLGSWDPRWT